MRRRVRVIEEAAIYLIKHLEEVIYVGQTRNDVQMRFWKHLSNARTGRNYCPALYRHMVKNKCEGYSWETIEIVDFPEADSREKYWIHEHETRKKCNITAGGISPKGEDHYLYGVNGGCRKAVEASVAARKGKKLSEDHRKKQSIGQQKRADVRPIRCVQTGEMWESVYACARHFGVSDGAVRNRLDPNKKLRHNVTSNLKHYLFEKLDKDDPGWQQPNHGQVAAATLRRLPIASLPLGT